MVGGARVAGIAAGGERGGGRSYCLHGHDARASGRASKGARRPPGVFRTLMQWKGAAISSSSHDGDKDADGELGILWDGS